jgi:hypothetical protein
MEPGLRELLENAPETQLDKSLQELIKKWSIVPTSLEILQVLDQAAYASLASDFAMQVLDLLFQEAITREGTTRETVVEAAPWRKHKIS